MSKIRTLLLFLFLAGGTAIAQPWSNVRQKNIKLSADTISLDSLSIIKGSVLLTNSSGNQIDTSLYKILYSEALLIKTVKGQQSLAFRDSIHLQYRVFPYSFSQETYHKNKRKIGKNEEGISDPFILTYENESSEIFKFGGLNKSGSISRGVSFGNNQDVVVNSSLNLQMAGRVNDNIDVLAAITDENIPFQPEGNTQQLQEFDKVFIQLTNNNNKLIAGDYELKKPDSYFMNFYKKAQGGSFTTVNTVYSDQQSNPEGVMRTGLSVAVSKGKFAKNSIVGTEGNQGPYKLSGANNELFIVVLSGSEKVYINGALLERGLQNDYIIDYNTAQLTFTARRLISKDSRITVEFQYSDKNYLRSLVYFNDEFENKKWKLKFNMFSEQDNKNQPLQQQLSNRQKEKLRDIGDSLNEALVANVDTVGFNPDQVLYKKVDSLDVSTSLLYKDIYVYSTEPDKAIYRVGFSFVGQGKGNYLPANTAANGKVYQWIMPLAGVPQGAYEPVTLLVTPKVQQLYTFGAEYAISKNTHLITETAMSNYDVNTFSKKDKADNIGFAEKAGIRNSLPLDQDTAGWKLNSGLDYEITQKVFKPIERFRGVEFERDWNLGAQSLAADEQMTGITAGVSRAKNGFMQYRFKRYIRGADFNAYSNGFGTDFKVKKFRLLSDASIMRSSAPSQQTTFVRHKADLSKALKHITLGMKEESEDNQFHNATEDTLQKNSYRFNSWEGYFQNPDTTQNKFRIFYGQRKDFGVKNNTFKESMLSDNTGLSFGFLKNQNNRITLHSTYRRLTILDSTLTSQKSGNSLLNNIDHQLQVLKGAMSFSTFYEIGTGQELKKEYAFLEVPPGQGTYAWVDYNNNGVKELNEFEIANSSDQAKYVKVLVPTNEYVRTNSNQFTEVLNLNPAAMMDDPQGFNKFLSRFSHQLLFRRDRKITDEHVEKILNPFVNVKSGSDSSVALNSSVQNIFYFNRSSSKFGFDIGSLNNRSKSLFTNGIESNTLFEKNGNIRWNMSRVFGITFSYKDGEKANKSEFFSTRNYHILYNRTEPKFIIQTSTSFRIILSYEFTHKANTYDTIGEKADQHKAGMEIKYSTPKQGTIMARFNYINIQYNAAENSPIAYEMLEGFKKGENFTWGLSVQRTLSSGLQLSLNYEGRKPASVKVIHTGGVSLRAYF